MIAANTRRLMGKNVVFFGPIWTEYEPGPDRFWSVTKTKLVQSRIRNRPPHSPLSTHTLYLSRIVNSYLSICTTGPHPRSSCSSSFALISNNCFHLPADNIEKTSPTLLLFSTTTTNKNKMKLAIAAYLLATSSGIAKAQECGVTG